MTASQQTIRQKPPARSSTPSYANLIDRAASLYGARKLDEAALICLDILETNADDFNALHLLGLVELDRSHGTEAIRYFDQALKIQPDDHLVHNNRGNAHQAMKWYDTAIENYDRALAIKPDYAPALANRGNALQKLQRHGEAIECYDKALAIKPDYAEALNNRGNSLHALSRDREACDSYDASLAVIPDYAEAHYNRGIALTALGDYTEAIVSYDTALRIRPGYASAHSNRGNALQALERYDDALQSYTQALARKPDYAEALNNRGAVLHLLERYAEALECYDSALKLDPRYVDALTNRGVALQALDRFDEAIENYESAVLLRHDHAQAYFHRGVALQSVERHGEAIESYDKALALKPDSVESLNNRGYAMQELGQHHESIAYYDRALSIKPDYASVWNNRGRALQAIGRHAEAFEHWEKALVVQPDHADAQLNKSMMLLLRGDLAEGFAQYEARWRATGAPVRNQPAKTLWLGDQDIAGKRLLIHAEQGFGDTIQFCRYAKQLALAGAQVVLGIPPQLARLLGTLDGVSEIVFAVDQPLKYDLHCPLLSLPHACRTTLETIPAAIPYLRAEQPWLGKWSAKLGATDRLRIGVAWSGSTKHKNDKNRSIPFAKFAPLLSLPVDWICLQNEIRETDRAALAALPQVRHFEDDIEDFSDVAAMIALCDLVISIDSAGVHLAGAMGKPFWMLLPFAPDWRWMFERDDTPWYPTGRLFRQPAIADWDSVIDQVKRKLERGLQRTRPKRPSKKSKRAS